MKVLIILTWNRTDKSYRSRLSTFMSYAPTTLGALSAIIKEARPGWTVETIDEMSKRVLPEPGSCDLVLISSVTSSVRHGYELAQQYRNYDIPVCMGGYHVSLNPEEALNYCDSVIIGPGETAIREMLDDFENNTLKPKYTHGNLDGRLIPAPDRKAIPMKRYLKYPAVTANSSCPNGCSYCVISRMWRNTTPRPVINVIKEIRSLHSKIIIFYDPNFFGNRQYALQLMKALEPLGIIWAGTATVEVGLDEELLLAAKKSGCSGLVLGLESMKRSTLQKAGKPFNDPKDYKKMIERIQSHGISVNGCFILGMDGDSEEDLRSLPEQVDYLKLNLARFAILTPVPGSILYEKMEREGRIIDRNWDHYTQHRAVFSPESLSPERLEEIYLRVWKETYTFRRILRRVKNMPGHNPFKKLIGLISNIGFKFLGIEE